MADNQITPFQLTDQFTMDNFNQRINETNTALQNKPGRIGTLTWYSLPLGDGVPHGENVYIRYAKDDAGMVYLYLVYQYSLNNASTFTGYLDIAYLPEGFMPQLTVTLSAYEPWVLTNTPIVKIYENGKIRVYANPEQYGCEVTAMFPAIV